MSETLTCAGRHRGWEVWVLVREDLQTRSAPGLRSLVARREPLAILLRRDGATRAFALTPDLARAETLAEHLLRARE